MGDHELELHGRFGLPEVGGFAARLEARYKAAWGSRGAELVKSIETQSGLTPEEVGHRLEENGPLRDAFWTAGQRAIEVEDPEYRVVLGRIVAAALDEARVDEAAYLLAQLVKLEPVHLRALLASFQFLRRNGQQLDPTDQPNEAAETFPEPVYAQTVADKLQVSLGLASVVVNALEAAGFLEQDSSGPAPKISRRAEAAPAPRKTKWKPTVWAHEAVRLIFPNVER